MSCKRKTPPKLWFELCIKIVAYELHQMPHLEVMSRKSSRSLGVSFFGILDCRSFGFGDSLHAKDNSGDKLGHVVLQPTPSALMFIHVSVSPSISHL